MCIKMDDMQIRIFLCQRLDSLVSVIRGAVIDQHEFTVQPFYFIDHFHAHLYHLTDSMGRSVAWDHYG